MVDASACKSFVRGEPQDVSCFKQDLESWIWSKHGAGFGKKQNILAGNRIWQLQGKRDSPQFVHGMRDFCPLYREREIITPTQIDVLALNAI